MGRVSKRVKGGMQCKVRIQLVCDCRGRCFDATNALMKDYKNALQGTQGESCVYVPA